MGDFRLPGRVAQFTTDVLVIGGGMAACVAAIEAKKHKLEVLMVDKGKIGTSGTSPRCGGAGNDWALLPPEFGGDPRDSHDVQLHDCVTGGGYLNVQDMTDLFNRESLERLVEMESYGVKYTRKPDGRYDSQRLMNCSYARGVLEAVGGSMAVMRTMKEQVSRCGVQTRQNMIITKLLFNEGKVTGAIGFDVKTGQFNIFKAGATILASGSATGVFKYPTCVNELTGDSYYLAYEIGLPLMNMEFLQFSITPKIRGVHVRGGLGIKPMISSGAVWVNSLGERVMEKYYPEELELAGWWKHAYAIYKENAEGRGPVYLDQSKVKDDVRDVMKEESSSIFNVMRRMGMDPRRERLELIPGLHTFLGGAIVNKKGETAVPGLYAAGEAAGQGGIFGADRTGGGIPAAQVLGHRCGKYAAEFARKSGMIEPRKHDISEEKDRINSLLKTKGESPYKLEQQIKEAAFESLSISRNGSGLNKGISRFSAIRSEALSSTRVTSVPELVKTIEVRNLALTGEMVARAALLRTESRGQHRREEFPETDNRKWLKWIVISRQDKGMKLEAKDVPIHKYRLKPANSDKKM